MPGIYSKKEKKMQQPYWDINRLFSGIQETASNICAMLTGVLTSIIGYFIPVRDIVHVLLIFFLLDVIFGYWAARRLRKERFSVKIIWNHTIPRMLISIVLIIGAFMWDNTYNMDMISTYKLIGWFISGVILYSIAENGYKITKWSVFPKIGNLLNKGVKEKTGMDVNEKEEEKC